MAKVTMAADGTATQTETTIIEDVVDAALAPVKLLSSSDNVYYSGRTLGLASIGYGLGGYAVGARFPSVIPLIGIK